MKLTQAQKYLKLSSDLIEKEIKWCKKHPEKVGKKFRKGFIAGLVQAQSLVDACLFNSEHTKL